MGAAQSARKAAAGPLLPDGPLLRLSPDIWTQITSCVDYTDIRNLLLTGNRAVRNLVIQNCQVVSLTQVVHSIDFERITHTCNELANLRELRIEPPLADVAALHPKTPLRLPPTLTELYLSFLFATEFALSVFTAHATLPNLTSLSLVGESTEELDLELFQLPPKLSTLILLGCTSTTNKELGILNLPRSITNLTLQIEKLPTFTKNCWPPQLESLALTNLTEPIIIEHLPRTVVQLTLGGTKTVSTQFKDVVSGNTFDFPWRHFFPFMTLLTLLVNVPGKIDALLRSVISPTAYDSVLVDEFISGGFWRLDDVDLANHVFPPFKSLFMSSDEFDDSITPVLRDLAPHLTEIRYLASSGPRMPLEALQYLPNYRMYSSEDIIDDPSAMPSLSHLEALQLKSTPLKAVKELKTLRIFNVSSITCDEDSLQLPWPTHLNKFELAGPLPQGLFIHSLPSWLTNLRFTITTNDEWTTLATYLVHLVGLTISMDFPGEWMQSDRLTPIASPYLHTAVIAFTSSPSKPQPKRFMDEFFGAKTPFPPSLTKLSIATLEGSALLIPMTVCPYLPRQLKSLTLGAQIAWSNSDYKCEAPIVHLSPAELVANLPPKLETLSIAQVHATPVMTYELLSKLPRSLTEFSQLGYELFSGPPDPTLLSVLLPPKLVTLSFQPNLDWFYFLPHRRLFRGFSIMEFLAAFAAPGGAQNLVNMYFNQMALAAAEQEEE